MKLIKKIYNLECEDNLVVEMEFFDNLICLKLIRDKVHILKHILINANDLTNECIRYSAQFIWDGSARESEEKLAAEIFTSVIFYEAVYEIHLRTVKEFREKLLEESKFYRTTYVPSLLNWCNIMIKNQTRIKDILVNI